MDIIIPMILFGLGIGIVTLRCYIIQWRSIQQDRRIAYTGGNDHA